MQEDIRTIKSVISSTMYDYLGNTGTKLLDFFGNILFGLLILFIGFKLIKHIVKIIDRVLERSRIDSTLHSFLVSFLKIGMKILVIFCAVARIGVGTSSIIALLGSAGVAVGLSLQGSLSNIAGGVILLFMKPFEAGDYILEDSSSKEGTVESVGIMYTKLLSPEDKTILIPNGNLAGSSITNYTSKGKRRVEILVGIEYNENIERVRKILSAIIEKEEARLPEDPMQIFLHEFQDSCICMGVRYWTSTDNFWESKWRVQEKIKTEFDKNRVSIPFNRMDINILRQN